MKGDKKVEIQAKMNALKKIKELLASFKERDETSQNKELNFSSKPMNLRSLKEQHDSLFDGAPRDEKMVPLTKEEKETLEKWELKDQKIEEGLVEVNSGLDVLMQKTLLMKDGIQKTTGLVDQVDNQVDQVSANVESANKKLKKVIKNFRPPSKCCLDITLLLMFLGLIGLIINMIF